MQSPCDCRNSKLTHSLAQGASCSLVLVCVIVTVPRTHSQTLRNEKSRTPWGPRPFRQSSRSTTVTVHAHHTHRPLRQSGWPFYVPQLTKKNCLANFYGTFSVLHHHLSGQPTRGHVLVSWCCARARTCSSPWVLVGAMCSCHSAVLVPVGAAWRAMGCGCRAPREWRRPQAVRLRWGAAPRADDRHCDRLRRSAAAAAAEAATAAEC